MEKYIHYMIISYRACLLQDVDNSVMKKYNYKSHNILSKILSYGTQNTNLVKAKDEKC